MKASRSGGDGDTRRELEWIRRNMPFTADAARELPAMTGIRLACNTPLDAKMITFIRAVLGAGAEVPQSGNDQLMEMSMRSIGNVCLAASLLACVAVIPVLAAGGSEAPPPFEERYRDMEWEDIVAEARGQELYFYMWGGSDSINRFVQEYLADRLMEEYAIELQMVPVSDASVFVNKVLGEKQAGRLVNGSVDAMWINGENFRSMKEADLLFGPYASHLPNIRYVDRSDPSVANDFGYPVEGYESPYGSAQFVMIYDSEEVPEPPRSVGALLDWIEDNPGRFTYTAPPDFAGSAFVRHIFYHVAGGPEEYLGPFDEELYEEVATETWEALNGVEPALWRQGNTYPETPAQLQDLFANGQVYFDIAYNPSQAANLVAQGRYPESTRTFVFDEGTIGNTHYLAIPFNSPHKAAAMVLANLVLDPEVQFEKSKPDVWGDLPVVSIDRLPPEWQERFRTLDRGPSVLSPDLLGDHRLPELQATWLDAIEEGWINEVLQE
ncbi:MAG: ABC transporter substrate-binding protein [Spirochaetota bacterium]